MIQIDLDLPAFTTLFRRGNTPPSWYNRPTKGPFWHCAGVGRSGGSEEILLDFATRRALSVTEQLRAEAAEAGESKL